MTPRLWRRPAVRFWAPAWQRLGLPAVGAVAALVLAVLLEGVLTPMWHAQAQAAEQAAVARRTALADQRRAAREAKGGADAVTAWPASGQRDARLAHLLQLAQAHQISVRGVNQQPERSDAANPVAWNMVTVPVRGNYANLRAFVAEALQDDDALALDSVQLRRAEGPRVPVEAELTWSFAQAGKPAVRP